MQSARTTVICNGELRKESRDGWREGIGLLGDFEEGSGDDIARSGGDLYDEIMGVFV